MKAAIVFDMDGVLADTERLKLRAHRAAVEAAGGDRLDRDVYRSWMGGAHEGVVRAFLSASGLETSHAAVEAYDERFLEAYRGILSSDLQPTEGARELLTACEEEGRRLALVTSSERWMADIVLERLEARQAFVAVITADDVEHEKPHPEPYRKARQALSGRAEAVPGDIRTGNSGSAEDRPAGRAVAVEDTRSGVTSATAAGLTVIAVRHDLNRGHGFEEAAAVVDSLAPPASFLALVDEVVRARSGPTGSSGGRASDRGASDS